MKVTLRRVGVLVLVSVILIGLLAGLIPSSVLAGLPHWLVYIIGFCVLCVPGLGIVAGIRLFLWGRSRDDKTDS